MRKFLIVTSVLAATAMLTACKPTGDVTNTGGESMSSSSVMSDASSSSVEGMMTDSSSSAADVQVDVETGVEAGN